MVSYQLEKLRYTLENKIMPRDENLCLFDTHFSEEEINMPSINIQKLTSDSNLLIQQKIMEKIKDRIMAKYQSNRQNTLI